MLSADFPEARQARLFRAIVQLLEALAGGGRQLVVMVDDIQWADDASAQFLHYLARQAASRPMLALYAYRDEELDSTSGSRDLVESLRRETARAPHAARAACGSPTPKPLLDGPRRRGASPLRLHRETDGNAFFLMSMLQALREGEIASDARRRACRCRSAARRRCARGSRTCPRRRVRRSTSPRCSAGASTSTRLLAVTHEPEERAAARGRDAW